MTTDDAMLLVRGELGRAREFGPLQSTHEGYAVLLEELDELWEAIRSKDAAAPRQRTLEASHVAAMAVRFLTDLC